MNPLTSSTRLARGLLDINAQVLYRMLEISGSELRDGMACSRSYLEQLPKVRGLGQLVSLQRDIGSRMLDDTQRHLRERGSVLLRAAEDTGSLLTDVLYGGTAAPARSSGRAAASTASAKAASSKAKTGNTSKAKDRPTRGTTAPKNRRTAATRAPVQESANDAGLPLTEINGVGPALAKRLQDAGLASLQDVAGLDPKALEDDSHPLHDLKGRIAADRWIAQARRLVGAGKVVNL